MYTVISFHSVAPLEAPTEVFVDAVSKSRIFVRWRGVSTKQGEEPLSGYKVIDLGWCWVVRINVTFNSINHITMKQTPGTGRKFTSLYNII